MYKIIIFDDNKERLDSVKMLVDLSDDFRCVGTFEHCNDLIYQIELTEPDLILMDIDMPGKNGIEATALIRKSYPQLKVIIQTVFEEDEKIFQCLRVGANGYLLKKTAPDKFLMSLKEAMEGGAPMTGAIASKVINYFVSENAIKNKYSLTDREKEILGYLVKGHSYKIIAQYCGIAYNTVNNHIRNIYEKLYVNSATEAVGLAIKERLI